MDRTLTLVSLTDVGIFECVPSSGGAPTEIDFKGTNDSVSMYPGEALGNGGDTMDLSHTVFKQVDPTSGASAALQNLSFTDLVAMIRLLVQH